MLEAKRIAQRLRQLALPCAVALVAVIGRANAQSPKLSLSAHGQHGSIGLVFGGGHSRPSYTERCSREWIPGHYEMRCERVWVAGCSRQVWMPARYEWRYDYCGRPYRVCVGVGRWATVNDPGRYETRQVSVWVPGRWQLS